MPTPPLLNVGAPGTVDKKGTFVFLVGQGARGLDQIACTGHELEAAQPGPAKDGKTKISAKDSGEEHIGIPAQQSCSKYLLLIPQGRSVCYLGENANQRGRCWLRLQATGRQRQVEQLGCFAFLKYIPAVDPTVHPSFRQMERAGGAHAAKERQCLALLLLRGRSRAERGAG